MGRRKRRAKVTLAEPASRSDWQTYAKEARAAEEAARINRRASDLPINAVVASIIVKDSQGDRIEVLRSLRDDVVAAMHARGQIDEAQYQAGRRMQALYEQAEIGRLQAIDPAKEWVDGGRLSEPLTESVQRAIAEVTRLERVLGQEGSALMRDVLCLGYSIQRCAEARGMNSAFYQKCVGVRFRECLETLARELGLVGGIHS